MAPAASHLPRALALAALGFLIGVCAYSFGYYDSSIWAPAGLVLATLLVAVLVGGAPWPRGPALVALGGLAALALWSLLSSGWAPSSELALLEGNRLIVYVVLLGLVATLMRGRAEATWMVGAALAGVLVVAGEVVVRMLTDSGLEDLFLGGRLNEPLGYTNGQGDLFVLGMLGCLAAAEQRRFAVLAGAGAAAMTLLGGLAVLSQSRGVILAAAIGVIAALAVVPGRLRRAGLLAVVGAALAVAVPTLLDIYPAARAGLPADLVERATQRLVLAALAVGVVWGVIAGVRARAGAESVQQVRRAWGIVLAGAAVVAVGVALVSAGRISDYVDRQYDAFVAVGEAASPGAGSSRLVSGAGNRYDYWDIALRVFEDNPIRGAGAAGWIEPYFRERATTEDVRQPHSMPLQTLAELGLIGFLLLGVFIGGLAWAAVRHARAAVQRAEDRPLLAAGVGIVAAWLAHASVDWMHLLPGVTGLAMIGAALVLRSPEEGAEARVPGFSRALLTRAPPAAWAAVAVLLLVGALSLSRQTLAEYARSNAREHLADDPREALRLANRSLRLQGGAPRTQYVRAAALARLGDADGSEAALRAAVLDEPGNWLTYSLLGDLQIRRGERADAARAYRRAARLNPQAAELGLYARDPDAALGALRTDREP